MQTLTDSPGISPAPEEHPYAAFAAVSCADGRSRCPWALATRGTLADHDHEWGHPAATATEYFQALSLELFDSGLARWSQSGRHPSWYLHMADLDPARVARFDEDDVEDLLLNPELIRNRAKIEAVVHNAGVCAHWTLADWTDLLDSAGVVPLGAAPQRSLDLPDSTPEARRVCALLREQGLSLVGPVTAHRWLQRTAHAPGHVRGCFRAPAQPTDPHEL